MSKKSKKFKKQSEKASLTSVKPVGNAKKQKHKSKRLRKQLKISGSVPGQIAHKKIEKTCSKKRAKNRSFENGVTIHSAPRKSFGAASSDSEPEPISGDWHVGDDAGTESKGSPRNYATAAKKTPQPEKETVSSDLEESETDADEEVDQTGLEALFEDDMRTGQNEKSSRSNLQDSKKNLQPVNALKSSKEPSKFSESKSIFHAKPMETTHRPISWREPWSILAEVERRAVDLSSRSLYITPVPRDCTYASLKQLSPTMSSCRLPYNTRSKSCRKYAFLEYPDEESASSARKAILGRLFGSHSLNVRPVPPRFTANQGSERIDRNQLFISCLQPSVSKVDLQQLFPKATAIDYPLHPDGYALGYAIVKFVNEDVALEAFTDAHRRKLKGQPVSVNYVIIPNKSEKPKSDVVKNKRRKESATIHEKTPAKSVNGDSFAGTQKAVNVSTVKTESLVVPTKPKVIVQTIFGADEDITDAHPSDAQGEEDEFVLKPSGKPIDRKTNALSRLVNAQHRDLSVSPEGSSGSGDAHDSMPGSSDNDSKSGSDTKESSGDDTSDEDDASSAVVDEQGEDDGVTGPQSSNDSSGEAIDRDLEAVMKARRGSMRSLKTAGSTKRRLASGPKLMQAQIKRTVKPLELPVPSKRHKI